MLRLLRRRATASPVSFCDSCGQVCTAACRAETHRDRTRTDVLRYGALR
jgi:uncharacterized cysteine cluster protein YcgN (CxxCxxCC family)